MWVCRRENPTRRQGRNRGDTEVRPGERKGRGLGPSGVDLEHFAGG